MTKDDKKLVDAPSPAKKHIGEIGKLDTKKQGNEDETAEF